MRYFRLVIALFCSISLFSSCSTDFDVNAPWKDITVVYGLLNQNDSVHYLKITKAFLGEGDALMFSKIPDSSNYPDKLDVTIEVWDMKKDNNGNIYDSIYIKTIPFDTTTIADKEKGDSIFYYPYQLIYKSEVSKLNPDFTYKLFIKNKQTGKEITGSTELVRKMTDISNPKPAPARASFKPGFKNSVVWTTVEGGKRYQFVARFHYLEISKTDTSDKTEKFVDWIIFNDLILGNTIGGEELTRTYPCDAFYTVIGNGIRQNIPSSELYNYTRVAYSMEYIFSVAADDLNTYMEVTEPSYTIVQEKPPFTNIINGIGLFSSRYNNTKDHPIIQTTFSVETQQELKVNPNTYDLGF